ncbi:hypothetical protein EMPS_01975 [Entomortierella parvispora]|uniref:Uncharacterized protein n=1 Tax=Entomortierella parvispora TaxID=205924 RepID=A0A9P3H4K0_9FUNG|nr:hypothetical protein EMPS_01975 [Entomortierella parvispora]
MRMHATLALILGTSLVAIPFLMVRADPIIDTCLQTGCATVFSTLAPCGGGATNSTLQQDYIYTPTQSLGGCECNSVFYNAFSSCLACIASQGESSPEIQNQQDWVGDCENYGFNFTAEPINNSTNPSTSDNDNNSSGLSTGAIVGIVIGAIVLIALIGGGFFLKSRRGKKEKTERYDDQPTAAHGNGYPNESGHAGAAAAGAAGAAAVGSHDYHNPDYSDTYGQHQGQDEYYNNQPAGGFDNNYIDQGDYHNSYYSAPGQNQQDMMMHNLNISESYVPPPPIDTTIRPASPTAAAAAALAASPRPSDTFPQSLRSKPAGWGNNSRQQEVTSSLVSDPMQRNDKQEFDDGEQLEQPRDRYGFDRENYSPRGSMTPPRVNMQSYRDDFNRPSFEREPRRSGSDLGSVTGLNLARGTPGGLYENHNGSTGNGIADYDSQGEDLQQSPELARRRARAAELFSAEGTRR